MTRRRSRVLSFKRDICKHASTETAFPTKSLNFLHCWHNATGVTRMQSEQSTIVSDHMIRNVSRWLVQLRTLPPHRERSPVRKSAFPVKPTGQTHVPFEHCPLKHLPSHCAIEPRGVRRGGPAGVGAEDRVRGNAHSVCW
eukprot:1373084-Pleurochrysis_carterae.AAC.1